MAQTTQEKTDSALPTSNDASPLHAIPPRLQHWFVNLDVSLRQQATIVTTAEGTTTSKPRHSVKEALVRTNLPLQLTSFVGREQELLEIKQLLRSTNLLTLLGAGGSGKTRLALQAGEALLENFPEGVWFVDFTTVTQRRLVPHAVATVLKVRDIRQPDLSRGISEAIGQRRQLLIFDNCEHVVRACAQLAQHLLNACPNLQILATSREALRIEQEHVWRVPPLLSPKRTHFTSFEAAADAEAVQLFVARAQSHHPQFRLTSQNLPWIITLCQRLEGMPLAIELAAAQSDQLSPEQMLARIDHVLPFLGSGRRIGAARHKTMQAAIDWSYMLLSSFEQWLLNRLAVFAGSWTLEAALQIVTETQALPEEVTQGITRLIDKSLVGVEIAADGALHYRLLATIRAYAYEKLVSSGSASLVHRRHADYYLALAEAAETALVGSEQLSWLMLIEHQLANIRSAIEWGLENGHAPCAARMAAALRPFWLMRSSISEGRRWLEAALVHKNLSPHIRAKALVAAGRLARQQSDLAQAMELLEAGLKLQEQLISQQGIALTLGYMGVVAYDQQDFVRAEALHSQSLALREALNDRWGSAATLSNLGEVARQQGDYTRSAALHHRSLAIFRELGDRWGLALVLTNLGTATHLLGDQPTAKEYMSEGLLLYHQLNDKEGIAAALEGLAIIAAAQGDGVQAAHCGGLAAAVRQAISIPLSPADLMQYEQQLVPAREQLGAERFATLWDKCLALSLEEALSYATTSIN
jgi:predicted ATPase